MSADVKSNCQLPQCFPVKWTSQRNLVGVHIITCFREIQYIHSSYIEQEFLICRAMDTRTTSADVTNNINKFF